ncbi:DUF7344 domain-containing protein [Natronolimnohabitans innermongolicus]|uniref:DUF7344 domain-containing protein n=1 Tax=Natronolimnohabitans innermongolicus JCM 12255 TaxID=1227499 RepID=L9XKY5_9EURY|nr:hypothetical protein [Natronolimnohabitans innermongolicus]ELY62237.1 hypothetical protein C493_00385 [Natronolimnohabitans innermongolicus JCM 12255]
MSNPRVSDRSAPARDDLFDALAASDRREALRLVRERSPNGITKSDLAYELAAVTADKPLAEVTDEDHQRARVDCHHRTLPALLEAGLVETIDDDRVVAAENPSFDAGLEAVVDGRVDATAATIDAVFDALADARRRTILSVLANQYHPISVETLARDVAAREADVAERDVGQDRVAAVRTSLIHVHLPRLNDAGLVGYDADTGSVSYEGHPILRVEWLDGVDTAEGTPDGVDLESQADGDGIRTLHGRENIVTTGQSLCEQAEDELFMLFTTTGLLEEGCFRRIEDALDRGVDVYVGSPDARVREMVRERAPEVVLWEPRLDWLDLSPNGETVGRLVFADREAVLLGTLGASTASGKRDETAIVGEGVDNGLVVLMRQLLGSRLDEPTVDEVLDAGIPL